MELQYCLLLHILLLLLLLYAYEFMHDSSLWMWNMLNIFNLKSAKISFPLIGSSTHHSRVHSNILLPWIESRNGDANYFNISSSTPLHRSSSRKVGRKLSCSKFKFLQAMDLNGLNESSAIIHSLSAFPSIWLESFHCHATCTHNSSFLFPPLPSPLPPPPAAQYVTGKPKNTEQNSEK